MHSVIEVTVSGVDMLVEYSEQADTFTIYNVAIGGFDVDHMLTKDALIAIAAHISEALEPQQPTYDAQLRA